MMNFKKSTGITLIALVITVIILVILAAVAVSAITGNDGLFSKANEAGTKYNESAQNEKNELDGLLGWMNGIFNSTVGDGNKINEYSSLLSCGKALSKAGETIFSVNGIVYSANVIIINEDTVLDGVNTYSGSQILNENNEWIYEFGDKNTDVATATEYAKNMVILKINGNLTINENVKLTACKSDDGFGGPKGLFVYCTGTITNNGEISMTARGAKAEGEDVYLWQNADKSYELVPAVGGAGGESFQVITKVDNAVHGKVGNPGHDGEETGNLRATGGGGTGGSWVSGNYASTTTTGAGSTGTSYSGGVGSGSVNVAGAGTYFSLDASENGGSGGEPCMIDLTANHVRYGDGGAGNPGGQGKIVNKGQTIGVDYDGTSGENGTGGLLILFSDKLDNSGKITANGSHGGITNGFIMGGSSGGGSINIFINTLITRGEIEAIGGATTPNNSGSYVAGKGGDGTVSVGSISSGSYTEIQ